MPCILRYGTELTYELGHRPVEVIGTSAKCTVILPTTSGLAVEHARLRRVGGRWLLEALVDDTFRLGDAPPSRIVWLTPGSTVEFVGSRTHLSLMETESELEPEVRTDSLLSLAALETSAVPPVVIRKLPPLSSASLLRGGMVLVVMSVSAFLLAQQFAETTPMDSPPLFAPSVRPSPDIQPPETVDAALQPEPSTSLSDGIVWIGIEAETRRMLCTGWVAATDRVVTVGKVALVDQEARASGRAKLFLYSNALNPPLVAVKEARMHPAWTAEHPDPDYQLSVLIPETLFPEAAVCQLASPQRMALLTQVSELRAGGYELPLSRNQPPALFNQVLPPALQSIAISLHHAAQIPGNQLTPTFHVTPAIDNIRYGWAAYDQDGSVVGTLVQSPTGGAMILPIDRLAPLLADPEEAMPRADSRRIRSDP